jgi:hypothetical protein
LFSISKLSFLPLLRGSLISSRFFFLFPFSLSQFVCPVLQCDSLSRIISNYYFRFFPFCWVVPIVIFRIGYIIQHMTVRAKARLTILLKGERHVLHNLPKHQHTPNRYSHQPRRTRRNISRRRQPARDSGKAVFLGATRAVLYLVR